MPCYIIFIYINIYIFKYIFKYINIFIIGYFNTTYNKYNLKNIEYCLLLLL